MISRTTERAASQTRLDSWKSIAQYLGRSPRTAQRWHSKYGLPVHHVGGDSGSAFTYTEELDEWLRNRSRTESDAPPVFNESVLYEKSLSQSDQVQCNEVLSSDTIPGLRTLNSQELVTHADRVRQSHSSSNLGARVQIAERKLKKAQQRLARAERSIAYWSRILADLKYERTRAIQPPLWPEEDSKAPKS